MHLVSILFRTRSSADIDLGTAPLPRPSLQAAIPEDGLQNPRLHRDSFSVLMLGVRVLPSKQKMWIRNIEYLDYLIEQEGGNGKVAAFLVEPIVGSNGVRLPPPDYLEKLQGLCRKWDLLLIVDETMTGMGRTGRMFACEHYGIEPDILVMGKALGAYCPLAATIFSNRVAASFDDNIFGIGQSFSGHALGCAAALAAIEVLQGDGFLQYVTRTGGMARWATSRFISSISHHF